MVAQFLKKVSGSPPVRIPFYFPFSRPSPFLIDDASFPFYKIADYFLLPLCIDPLPPTPFLFPGVLYFDLSRPLSFYFPYAAHDLVPLKNTVIDHYKFVLPCAWSMPNSLSYWVFFSRSHLSPSLSPFFSSLPSLRFWFVRLSLVRNHAGETLLSCRDPSAFLFPTP